jgi:opacity protein-like surface antigen
MRHISVQPRRRPVFKSFLLAGVAATLLAGAATAAGRDVADRVGRGQVVAERGDALAVGEGVVGVQAAAVQPRRRPVFKSFLLAGVAATLLAGAATAADLPRHTGRGTVEVC